MSRTTAKPLSLFLLLCVTPSALAEYGFGSLISPLEARRFGLQRVWFTQVEVDPARGQITDIQYFVSSRDSYTIHEVQYRDTKRVFSERDVDAFGEAVGVAEAKKLADEFLDELKVQEIFDKLDLSVDVQVRARRL